MEANAKEEYPSESKWSDTDLASHDSSKVTIGIPAYNEEGNIGALLRGLLAQASSKIAEIIVSDDGSSDGTSSEILQVVRGEETKHQIKVRLIEARQRSGKAGAVDKILKLARGHIIVLIDADTQIEKDCLEKIVAPFFKDQRLGVVSGNILPLRSENESRLFSTMSFFQRELNDQLCQRLVNENLAPKVNGAFFAFRKEVVSHIPSNVVSDDEYISWCAQRHGYTVTYVSGAKVYAKDPVTVKDYVSKRRRVLGGHFLIKNFARYDVPTTRIRLLLPETGRLIAKHWRKVPYLFVMIFLECLCRPLAFSDARREKVSPRYRVESAKTVAGNK